MREPMRLLFLDIDGVLNSCDTITESGPWLGVGEHRLSMLDVGMCVRLAGLLAAEPDVRVVLSSTWRLMMTADEMASLIVTKLEQAGHGANAIRFAIADGRPVPRFIGRTGETSLRGDERRKMGRGVEIQAWLESHTPDPLAQHVAILDDDSDMGTLSAVHVRTSWMTGLTPEHCTKARDVLHRPLLDADGFNGLMLGGGARAAMRLQGEGPA